ncbi:MAG: hypothetical protein ACJ77K_18300 [Bacteroidia bacterium]
MSYGAPFFEFRQNNYQTFDQQLFRSLQLNANCVYRFRSGFISGLQAGYQSTRYSVESQPYSPQPNDIRKFDYIFDYIGFVPKIGYSFRVGEQNYVEGTVGGGVNFPIKQQVAYTQYNDKAIGPQNFPEREELNGTHEFLQEEAVIRHNLNSQIYLGFSIGARQYHFYRNYAADAEVVYDVYMGLEAGFSF